MISYDMTSRQDLDDDRYINSSGKYILEIESVHKIVSSKGNHGIEIRAKEAGTNRKIGLKLWTHYKDGSIINRGYLVFSDLFVIANAEKITFSMGIVKVYDYDLKQMVEKKLETVPFLKGKTFGVLIRREEYEKSDGSIGESINVVKFFDAGDERTAKEIEGHMIEAKEVERLLHKLQDKILNVGNTQSKRTENLPKIDMYRKDK